MAGRIGARSGFSSRLADAPCSANFRLRSGEDAELARERGLHPRQDRRGTSFLDVPREHAPGGPIQCEGGALDRSIKSNARHVRPKRLKRDVRVDPNQPIEHLSTREGYDRWSEIYDEEDNPLIVLEERYLPDLLGDVRGLDLVDLGCGTGRHAVRIAAAGQTSGMRFWRRTASPNALQPAYQRRQPRTIDEVHRCQIDQELPVSLSQEASDRLVGDC